MRVDKADFTTTQKKVREGRKKYFVSFSDSCSWARTRVNLVRKKNEHYHKTSHEPGLCEEERGKLTEGRRS